MENLPWNAGGCDGSPSAALLRQPKYALPPPLVSLLRAARRSELMKLKAACSVDSKAMEAVAASMGVDVDVTTWVAPESRMELAVLVELERRRVPR